MAEELCFDFRLGQGIFARVQRFRQAQAPANLLFKGYRG